MLFLGVHVLSSQHLSVSKSFQASRIVLVNPALHTNAMDTKVQLLRRTQLCLSMVNNNQNAYADLSDSRMWRHCVLDERLDVLHRCCQVPSHLPVQPLAAHPDLTTCGLYCGAVLLQCKSLCKHIYRQVSTPSINRARTNICKLCCAVVEPHACDPTLHV